MAFAVALLVIAAPERLGRGMPGPVMVASLGFVLVLAALAAYDLEEMRLPDVLTWPLLPAGLLAHGWIGTSSVLGHAAAAAVGGLGLWAVARIYRAWRGFDGLGLGDVKLYAGLGAWVGLEGLATVLLWACLTALVAVAVAHFVGRRVEATTQVPFGIFLALGGWVTWIYGPLQ